jgi:hemoglobin
MRNVRGAITEQQIRTMVETFYERVRDDAQLGPVFEQYKQGSWPEHMDRMVDFWSSVLLGTGRYQGNPLAKHRAIPELRPEHFDRWLDLFADVLDSTLPEHVATDILWRAKRMRMVLDAGASPDAEFQQTANYKTRAAR